MAEGDRESASTADAAHPEYEGRSRKGQFITGWKGGTGKPGPRSAIRLFWADVLTEHCTKERLAAAYLKLWQMGVVEGNLAALKEWLDRSVGREQELLQIDHNTIEGTIITPDMQVTAMDETVPAESEPDEASQ